MVNQSPVRDRVGTLNLEEHSLVADHATVKHISPAVVKHRDHATARIDLDLNRVEEFALIILVINQEHVLST